MARKHCFGEQEAFSLAVSTYASLTSALAAASVTWYLVRKRTHGWNQPESKFTERYV